MTARNLFLSSVLVLLGVAAATGQSSDVPPPPMFKSSPLATGEITSQMLLADRIAFVKEGYGLSEEQLKKVTPLLEQLVPAQDRYDLKVRLTLRRTALAISITAASESHQQADPAATITRLQEQILAIHAAAPLSLGNVIKLVEPLLPKEQVEAARSRMKNDLAARLKRNPADIVVEKIDDMLASAVAPAGVSPVQPQPTQPPAQSHAKAPPAPPPPPQPPKPLAPAPPEAQWTKDYEAIITKYGFTEDQKNVAESALKSCLDRAATHRAKSKADFEKADKMSDAAAKEQALQPLRLPLDKLYDELIQRTESLATLEQKLRADGKLTIPPKAPPTAAAPAAQTLKPSPGAVQPPQSPATPPAAPPAATIQPPKPPPSAPPVATTSPAKG